MADETNNFVVIKKGEAADPKAGLPYDQAVPEILRGWETDKYLESVQLRGWQTHWVTSTGWSSVPPTPPTWRQWAS